MKISTPAKSIIVIIACLALVGFFESGRIRTLALGLDDSPMKTIGLASALFAANLKERIIRPNVIDISSENESAAGDAAKPAAKKAPEPKYLPPSPPFKVLVVGDSFMAERMGPKLEKALSGYASTTIFREGIYSTGLSRQDYFDWEKEISALMEKHNPNVAVVMFGANDAQGAIDRDGAPTPYTDPAWDEVYAARVRTFAKVMTDRKVAVFWIGMPMPRDPGYREKMARLNTIYEQELKTLLQATFLPTWNMLSDENGGYAAYLPDENGVMKKTRESDGIHPTDFGAEIIVRKIIRAIADKAGFQKSPPDPTAASRN